jgi:hypothetical protein
MGHKVVLMSLLLSDPFGEHKKKKEKLIMKKTISSNSFIISQIDGTISNYPKLEKKKFYVLIDLVIRHSKYNGGMHAYLMSEILRGQ